MNVYVECKPDEVLALSLGILRKHLTHNNDKGRVCNTLEKKVTKSIGLIDEDPNSAQPTYLSKLTLNQTQYDIRVLEDQNRGNKIIILCPRLEEWVIKVCKSSNLSLSQYGLSDTGRELHRELTNRPDKLSKILKRLIDLKSPSIIFLKSLIN